MKFIASLALTALLAGPAFALPQDSTPSSTVVMTPQQTCIVKCPAGDVNCQAACVGTAHPNEQQANDTTQCAMKCDQGDGSPAATEKYSQCVQACISAHFPTSQTVGAPQGTQGSTSNPTGGANPTGSGSENGSPTPTGSGSAKTPTGAASSNKVAGSAVGVVGLFMAIFAL